MGLSILFRDELIGFYKSKVMIFLWVGMPLMVVAIKYFGISSQEIPGYVLSAMLVSSLAGFLSSFMIVAGLINEKNKSVYDLFMIKPIKRRDILLAKFCAVFLCVAIANFLAVGVGMLIDIFNGSFSLSGISYIFDSLVMSFSSMSIACSAAVLIGVLSNSILVGVIMIIYGGNQLAGLIYIPTFMGFAGSNLITFLLGAGFTILFIYLAVLIFNRKQF